MLADLGLTPDTAGKMLHVHPRTVRYWISGKTLIPYSAYRLLRILTGSELPCSGWDGWHMHSGMLWSPEGYGFKPNDSSWWSLLVRQARSFKTMYDREACKRGASRAELAMHEPAPSDGLTSRNRADVPAGGGVQVTRHFIPLERKTTDNSGLVFDPDGVQSVARPGGANLTQTAFWKVPDFRVQYGQNVRKGGV